MNCWRKLMRNKTQFWTLLLAVAILVMTSSLAFAAAVPLVDGTTGKPWAETEDPNDPDDGPICDDCKDDPDLDIVFADCTTQVGQYTTTTSGSRYVFDRDAAFDWAGALAGMPAGWAAEWLLLTLA